MTSINIYTHFENRIDRGNLYICAKQKIGILRKIGKGKIVIMSDSSNIDSPFEKKDTIPGVGGATTTATTTYPIINHRVLLSLKESAKVIGTKGSTIQRIRESNHVKIGLSEKQPGCSDRVLSCAGRIPNVSNAIGDVVDTLNTNRIEDNDGDNTSSGFKQEEKYPFHFLNHILPPPSKDEIKDAEQLRNIGSLRLLVTNSQLSSIIGKGGIKIKSLIDKHGVKIVASRDFLPDSDERVLEMQGFPGSITNTLMEISEILLNEMDINFASERRYYPHLRTQSSSKDHKHINTDSSLTSTNDNNNNNSDNTSHNDNSDVKYLPNEFKATLKIPESYVGAIVGRQGNRIANLRKFTKTKIIVEKKNDKDINVDLENRTFTIYGDHLKNVRLAESMLRKNLDVEIEKREARINSRSINADSKAASTDGIEETK